MNRIGQRFAFTALLLLALVTQAAVVQAADNGGAVASDQRGAVATVNPLATQAGIDALEKGGNAIDAAVAAALTLGVVDGHNSGIGGGCFILVRWADGTVQAIDGREMAPAAAHRDMYVRDGKVDPELSKTGALAIGIPGSVAAYEYLLRRGGKLSYGDLLLSAAELAEKGFPTDRIFAGRLARSADKLRRFPGSAAVLLDKEGNPWPAGHRLQQADLANTYRQIAKHGAAYFYKGEFAVTTARWMRENGGIVTAKDFAGYELKQREPVKTDYRDYTLYGFPPPSSGGVHVAQILNTLEPFELAKLSDVERYHVIGEAMKLAFADRAFWLGDPDFAEVPRGLTYEQYARKLAARIELDKAIVVPSHGQPPNADTDLFGKHTTHIATADKQGNWVAITTTVNTSFGSKVIIPGTGVIMNNQMDDFSAQPGVPNAFGLVGMDANSVQPGKRPLSSMSPTIVLKSGKPVMTVGAAGGPTIITQVVQAVINHLDMGKPLYEALVMPRIHQQWKPDLLFVEKSLPADIRAGLSKRGHTLKEMGPYGSTQAIALARDGRFVSVAEPRLKERNAAE